MHEPGFKSVGGKADMLRRHLGRLPGVARVVISSTAYGEARDNLRRDTMRMRAVDKVDAERVYARAAFLIDRRLRNNVCADDLALVGEVLKMYGAVRSNPKSQKLAEWYSLKSRHVARPILGSGGDLTVLSTSAQHARRQHAELWARDIDFTMFAGEIAARFNVEVVGAYRLDEGFVGQELADPASGRAARAPLADKRRRML